VAWSPDSVDCFKGVIPAELEDALFSYKGWSFAFLLFIKQRFMFVGTSEGQASGVGLLLQPIAVDRRCLLPVLRSKLDTIWSLKVRIECMREDRQCWV